MEMLKASEDSMLFGQMVAVAREESRLGLRELAGRINASAALLSKIESAGYIPHDPIITRLIEVLCLDEKVVRSRVARQRAARDDAMAQSLESDTALSAVPIVGKIGPERQ